jgi:uncharacterized membrane protein
MPSFPSWFTPKSDPAWPWSEPGLGRPALALVALLLIGLTVWTYRGVPGASPRRVLILIGLRLAALILALLAVLRPSLALQKDLHPPSTLLILADASESMTIQDALDGQTRWDALRRLLHQCEPVLDRLREEHNLTAVLQRFAGDVDDYDPQGKADGKSTDFGTALHTLYERYQHERRLRGLFILSDGANNRNPNSVPTEAAKWRKLPCPIHTFAFGRKTTSDKQSDLAFVDPIQAIPSPVPVKGKLTVKGSLNAPGLTNVPITLRLFVDDKEISRKVEKLPKETGNEVSLSCDAPPTPGEIKVTLKVDPLRSEAIRTNNEISTYVPVTKDGVSILYVEGKYRAWEPKFIREALRRDPRFRLYEAVRTSVEPPPPNEEDFFQLEKRHYDVIILGDVSPNRLSAGNPQLLAKIADMVAKGTGLLMIGGYESFTSTRPAGVPPDDATVWRETPLAKVLPVELNDEGQVEQSVAMVPTAEGLSHYILRLAERDEDNAALWQKLPPLAGMSRLGRPKIAATVLARDGNARTGTPVLVAHEVDKGRVLAFAGDTTYRWRNLGLPDSKEGVEAHARFWKQVMLWLASQEKGAGNVWVMPDMRRLPAGSKLEFSVGLRGKTGKDLSDARFEVTVETPQKTKSAVPTARKEEFELTDKSIDSLRAAEVPEGVLSKLNPLKNKAFARRQDFLTELAKILHEGDLERFKDRVLNWARKPSQSEERGTFVWTEAPGEYRLVVDGKGKDVDGSEITGTAESRFLVYHDDTELTRQAADHDFLTDLATKGGGQFHQAVELESILQELPKRLPMPSATSSAQRRPDWRTNDLSGFLVGFFLLFVMLLCLEWFLRRSWGLV